MPKLSSNLLSLDTETLGLDLFHGAKPFFITTCEEGQEPVYWEWDVDPLTREPQVVESDLAELEALIRGRDLVLQNAKFDQQALATISNIRFPWERTFDTLIAGHLLCSNGRHDLTSMAMDRLGVNIEPAEVELKLAVNEARRMVKRSIKKGEDTFEGWRLAEKDLPDMPSAKPESKEQAANGLPKSSPWGFDMWLPRAVAKKLNWRPDHPWWMVLRDYSCLDSKVTLDLFLDQKKEIEELGLWKVYLEALKVQPVAARMQSNGVTVIRESLRDLKTEYAGIIDESGKKCLQVASRMGEELVLPAGAGVNNSLRRFCFEGLKLPILVRTETGAPSLGKEATAGWLSFLEEGTEAREFVEALQAKRKRDTSTGYMKSYEKFWLPLGILNSRGRQCYMLLHPSLNITGTDTLRWSCTNPNTQQISKQETQCPRCQGEGCRKCNFSGEDLHSLRKCFGPAPGREWISMDAKNIELRIPAFEAQELEMMAIFNAPDQAPYFGSYHLLVFGILHPELFKKHGAKVKDLPGVSVWYQRVKNGNFAIAYGAQEETADRAYGVKGAYRKIKARFRNLEKLNQKYIDMANRLGYVTTIPDRSVDPDHGYPIRCARTEWGKVSPTVPLNYHVQSTAMWWMRRAMTRCQDQLDLWNRKAGEELYKMVLQVHDELVFDFPLGGDPVTSPKTSNLARIKTLQNLAAKGGDDIGVPISVSAKRHVKDWSTGQAV